MFTGGGDEEAIARGVYDTYLRRRNLRYSQMAPLDMYDERNTGNNLPAEIKIAAVDGDAYKFLFMAKGGGSANKSYLFQETKALLNENDAAAVDVRQDEDARHRGLPAVPPRRRRSAARRPSSPSRPPSSRRRTTSTRCPTHGLARGPRVPRPRARRPRC